MNQLDYTETDILDFARCQRPDGSYYGTSGTCRKGTAVSAKEMKALKSAAKKGNKKAKAAVAVAEGKVTKKEAAKALAEAARREGKGKSVPSDMKKELAALKSAKDEATGDAKVLNKRFKDSKKEIGEGAYGAVKETAQGTVIKKGMIGKDEITVQQKLADVDGVPKLIDHAYTSKPFADRNGDRKGIVEMQKARGEELMKQQFKLDNPATTGQNATKIQDEYIRLRKDMHTRGVAHGDMHEGNVTWDGQKMGVLDFGLSKPTYKAALDEALGTFGVAQVGGRMVGDFRSQGFFDGSRRNGASTTGKVAQLQRKVEQIQKKAGGSITEKRAKQLIEELYDGI